jgi:hypothetical protein
MYNILCCYCKQALDVRILEVFFPLTGGLLSQHTYGFEMNKSKVNLHLFSANTTSLPASIICYQQHMS